MSSSDTHQPTVLGIETSEEFASVSICRGNIEWYGATFFLPRVHAMVVAPLIERAMKQAALNWKDIDAVAVGRGPGSYTGLRISTSIAKGICLAQSIPLVSVSTMENLAYQVFNHCSNAEWALVSLDARRSEVYAAILDRKGEFQMETKAFVLGDFDILSLVNDKSIVLAGSGSAKMMEFYHSSATWTFLKTIFPEAGTLARLAATKVENGEFEDIVNFEPDYLKPVYILPAR